MRDCFCTDVPDVEEVIFPEVGFKSFARERLIDMLECKEAIGIIFFGVSLMHENTENMHKSIR